MILRGIFGAILDDPYTSPAVYTAPGGYTRPFQIPYLPPGRYMSSPGEKQHIKALPKREVIVAKIKASNRVRQKPHVRDNQQQQQVKVRQQAYKEQFRQTGIEPSRAEILSLIDRGVIPERLPMLIHKLSRM